MFKNKFSFIILCLFISMIVIFAGCTDDNKNPVDPVPPESGDVTTPPPAPSPNVMTFYFNTTPKDFSDFSSVHYDSGTTTTFITARETGTNTYPNIQIIVPGKVAGTWTQADAGTGITYALSAGTSYFGTTYTITISSYGAVGQKVTGTFTGQLTGTVAPNFATNGIFNVTRLTDQ